MQQRLMRSRQDQMIAGVCSGIARNLAMDVTIVRLLFVVAGFMSFGAAALLYAILWMVLPVDTTPALQAPPQQMLNQNFNEMKNQMSSMFNNVKQAIANQPHPPVPNQQPMYQQPAQPEEQKQWRYDPFTGEAVQPNQAEQPRFDPFTGKPL